MCGVRSGVPGPELAGEELLGVVAPHPDRVVAEGPLERGRSVLLLAVRDDDRGVDVAHHEVGQLGARTLLAGTPSESWGHTWRRTRARAAWIFFNLPGVTSSRVRHAVGGDATGPSTLLWWRSTSMSAIASPPSASIDATSTRTRPLSWSGTKLRRNIALDSSAVRPVRSARSRVAMPPAWATTPTSSADTDKPADTKYGSPRSAPRRAV
jgi:hypothetical protein